MSIIDLGSRSNVWITEAEAKQLELTQRQMELNERAAELEKREEAVKKRERDVEEAEPIQKAAKIAEDERLKEVAQPIVEEQDLESLSTNEKIIRGLMKRKIPITVLPKVPYNESMIESIKEKGLVLSTDVFRSGRGMTILQFSHREKQYEITTVFPSLTTTAGHLKITLTPGDDDWTFFLITNVNCSRRYPMPKPTIELVSTSEKVL